MSAQGPVPQHFCQTACCSSTSPDYAAGTEIELSATQASAPASPETQTAGLLGWPWRQVAWRLGTGVGMLEQWGT